MSDSSRNELQHQALDEVLVSRADLDSVTVEADQLIQENASEFPLYPPHPNCRTAFRNYLLFSRWPELLRRRGIRLSREAQFYNTYFWFAAFVSLFEANCRVDAGLEQELSDYLMNADFIIDWSLVEQIDRRIDTIHDD